MYGNRSFSHHWEPLWKAGDEDYVGWLRPPTPPSISPSPSNSLRTKFIVWIVTLALFTLFQLGFYAADQLRSAQAGADPLPIFVYDATAAREAAILYSHELGSSRPVIYDEISMTMVATTPQEAPMPCRLWYQMQLQPEKKPQFIQRYWPWYFQMCMMQAA